MRTWIFQPHAEREPRTMLDTWTDTLGRALWALDELKASLQAWAKGEGDLIGLSVSYCQVITGQVRPTDTISLAK